MEKTTFSPERKLQTGEHTEYIADCPSEFNVTLLKSEIRKHLLYNEEKMHQRQLTSQTQIWNCILVVHLAAIVGSTLTQI